MNARLIIALILGVLLIGILAGGAQALIPGASDSILPTVLAGAVAGSFVVATIRRARRGAPPRS